VRTKSPHLQEVVRRQRISRSCRRWQSSPHNAPSGSPLRRIGAGGGRTRIADGYAPLEPALALPAGLPRMPARDGKSLRSISRIWRENTPHPSDPASDGPERRFLRGGGGGRSQIAWRHACSASPEGYRTKARLARARAQGKRLGRPSDPGRRSGPRARAPRGRNGHGHGPDRPRNRHRQERGAEGV
jgi:hypothetical protein